MEPWGRSFHGDLHGAGHSRANDRCHRMEVEGGAVVRIVSGLTRFLLAQVAVMPGIHTGFPSLKPPFCQGIVGRVGTTITVTPAHAPHASLVVGFFALITIRHRDTPLLVSPRLPPQARLNREEARIFVVKLHKNRIGAWCWDMAHSGCVTTAPGITATRFIPEHTGNPEIGFSRCALWLHQHAGRLRKSYEKRVTRSELREAKGKTVRILKLALRFSL